MPHAIIRGANGRRHEVEFGDAPVRVEIYASEETVEIFIEADFEGLPQERRRFALLNIPRHLFSEATAPQRLDVPRIPSCILGVMSDFATRAVNLWHDPVTARHPAGLSTIRRADRPAKNSSMPFPNGTPQLMERCVDP